MYSEQTQSYHTSNHATIWRWREAYQHDFAARIDWSNSPKYEDANHPPVAKLNHENEILVHSGETVTLSGQASTDPDGDVLTYKWFVYNEVGTMNVGRRGVIELQNADTHSVSFEAPATDKVETIHVILQVTDTGSPSLTRYQRVIVNVIPE
ncbi:PKD domain-containing protein [Maribacter litopenaei]|uniref:PKD domain-containing protein n=1 Tax=Maribacter litopenaei TaxID=2976127 RepID=A0ABY5Y5H1_9FLAO|nr:PKD domain-containing protein [Maribacter litopenaei]UWX54281.1 PKD domain-containing protein [Maribacter litopenaei]